MSNELPPLPDAVAHIHSDGDFCQERYYGNSGWPVDFYTADQMRDYAAAAVAAERERVKARAIQIVEWHRTDYNRRQIDPIVTDLRRGIGEADQ